MRPDGYYVIGLILIVASSVLNMSDAGDGIEALQISSTDQIQSENMNRMLRDMQDLVQKSSLNPELRAELMSLMAQTRLLRQKLNNSSTDSFQRRHRKQLQEIKLRLDAIKNILPPRPIDIRRTKTAIARSFVPPSTFRAAEGVSIFYCSGRLT